MRRQQQQQPSTNIKKEDNIVPSCPLYLYFIFHTTEGVTGRCPLWHHKSVWLLKLWPEGVQHKCWRTPLQSALFHYLATRGTQIVSYKLAGGLTGADSFRAVEITNDNTVICVKCCVPSSSKSHLQTPRHPITLHPNYGPFAMKFYYMKL